MLRPVGMLDASASKARDSIHDGETGSESRCSITKILRQEQRTR